ncbi:MAG: response regulator [Pyrinomonadaceae bacterium]
MDQPNRPRLLLADDSVTIRKVVELTFADEGIDVTTVGDSATAMSRFVEIQPDIVLVDAGLDGTSGYQICEMIKSDEATRHIPVLLLIGSFEPFDQDEAERVRADGFLTKPFHSIRDLVARVWELLGKDTATPQPTPAVVDAFGAEHESLEHISSDLRATPASNEDDDIDELYRSSFAETVEIDEYDTVDDMLGDSALDDEMIEASYPTEGYTDDLNGLIPEADPVAEPKDEVVDDTKEFDWSPAAVVAETIETPPAAFEPKFVFDETGDEPTEAIAEPVNEQAEVVAETTQFERIVDDEDLGLDALIGKTTTTEPEPAEEVAAAAAETVVEESEVEILPEEPQADTTEPEIWPEVESAPDEHVEPQMPVITPEMLDLIAERVVARLSDSVIREVALEAVPRIAEKLIREALSDTGRSNENKEAKETSA